MSGSRRMSCRRFVAKRHAGADRRFGQMYPMRKMRALLPEESVGSQSLTPITDCCSALPRGVLHAGFRCKSKRFDLAFICPSPKQNAYTSRHCVTEQANQDGHLNAQTTPPLSANISETDAQIYLDREQYKRRTYLSARIAISDGCRVATYNAAMRLFRQIPLPIALRYHMQSNRQLPDRQTYMMPSNALERYKQALASLSLSAHIKYFWNTFLLHKFPPTQNILRPDSFCHIDNASKNRQNR